VIWHPPVHSWLKCNIDGASKVNPGESGCGGGGIFRNAEADALICFAEPLGIKTSFQTELCGFSGNCAPNGLEQCLPQKNQTRCLGR